MRYRSAMNSHHYTIQPVSQAAKAPYTQGTYQEPNRAKRTGRGKSIMEDRNVKLVGLVAREMTERGNAQSSQAYDGDILCR
jgi:hypothetical protein